MAPRLVPLRQEYENEPVPVHFIHAARGVLPDKMRTFLDFAAGRPRIDLAELQAVGS
jgi:hypothetical protein